jgi:recombination protein RecA
MPKKKTKKVKGSGKLADVRKFTSAAIKKDDWEANLDPNSLNESQPHLKTGSMIIDHLIGGKPNERGVAPCPGLPKGRILNLYGHEGSGKTTLALEACAETCANGGTCGYIDWENEIVPEYAHALGVPIHEPDKFLLAQPDTLEEGMIALYALATAGVDLIILDSVGAGVPKKFFEKSLSETADQGRVGANAAAWSRFLPKLKRMITKTNSTVIAISQIRDSINTMGYGDKFTVQGGKAFKFFSALRMKLQRVKTEKISDYSSLTNKTEDRVTGAVIKAKLEKCKVSPQQGNEELFYIRWGKGIDNLRSLIEIGSSHKVIKKTGAWYSWIQPDGEELKMQGMEKFRKAFEENESYIEALRQQVMPCISQKMKDSSKDEEDELDLLDDDLKSLIGDLEE